MPWLRVSDFGGAPVWARNLVEGMLDLVFAPICVACREPIPTSETERLVCRTCWSRARPLPAPRCPRCWEPVPPGRPPDVPCSPCDGLPPRLRVARSAFLMIDPVREIVHALKYRGWEAVARPMAARMAGLPLPLDVVEEARLVVPVPVSSVRHRERGYNQAALLANAFAERTDRRCLPGLLIRSRTTETQTTLHPDERRANVAGAFAPSPGAEPAVRGEHVLLVDDVWTTGATALACTDALLEAGARVVSVITFARALPSFQRGADGELQQ